MRLPEPSVNGHGSRPEFEHLRVLVVDLGPKGALASDDMIVGLGNVEQIELLPIVIGPVIPAQVVVDPSIKVHRRIVGQYHVTRLGGIKARLSSSPPKDVRIGHYLILVVPVHYFPVWVQLLDDIDYLFHKVLQGSLCNP